MSNHSANLRRLMAQFGLTVAQVADRSGLDPRTVAGILHETKKRQARTLQELAAGLGISPDELLLEPSLLLQRTFDRAANPVVDEVLAEHPQLVGERAEADFDELYSRVGTGGGLTGHGALRRLF